MNSSRKRCSREFKLEVIRRMQEIGRRQAQVSKENWQEYATKQEAIEDVNWWIGTWYNQQKLHASLGHRPPQEYEQIKIVAELDVGISRARSVHPTRRSRHT